MTLLSVTGSLVSRFAAEARLRRALRPRFVWWERGLGGKRPEDGETIFIFIHFIHFSSVFIQFHSFSCIFIHLFHPIRFIFTHFHFIAFKEP